MTLADKVKHAGVVNAGGGGFPAYVKLAARRQVLGEAGGLVNAVVISRPHPDAWREIV